MEKHSAEWCRRTGRRFAYADIACGMLNIGITLVNLVDWLVLGAEPGWTIPFNLLINLPIGIFFTFFAPNRTRARWEKNAKRSEELDAEIARLTGMTFTVHRGYEA